MRRLLSFTVAGLLAASLPALAQTAKPSTTAKNAAPAKPSATWANGKLESVGADGKSIVIKQGTHEMTFALASDAKLMQGKKTLQASDLTNDVGRNVKIQYTTQAGTHTATRVEVSEPAKSGKK